MTRLATSLTVFTVTAVVVGAVAVSGRGTSDFLAQSAPKSLDCTTTGIALCMSWAAAQDPPDPNPRATCQSTCQLMQVYNPSMDVLRGRIEQCDFESVEKCRAHVKDWTGGALLPTAADAAPYAAACNVTCGIKGVPGKPAGKTPPPTVNVEEKPALAGLRSDFCSRIRDSKGECTDPPVRCATGWNRVCQGSCGDCGGQYCQCVRAETAGQPNACGNGLCEPGEFRTSGTQIIPGCTKDCASLAQSGTTGSSCIQKRLDLCSQNPQNAPRKSECEAEAKRFCDSGEKNAKGPTAPPASTTCNPGILETCKKALQGVPDAESRCQEQCKNPAGFDCSSNTGHWNCVIWAVNQSPPAADPHDLCRKMCQLTQGNTSLQKCQFNVLRKFETVGECCKTMKATPGSAAQAKACPVTCGMLNIPAGDPKACE